MGAAFVDLVYAIFSLIVATLLIGGIIYVIYYFVWRPLFPSSDTRKYAKQWMPISLQEATIVTVEELTSHAVSIPGYGNVTIAGRPDSIYQSPDGRHFPVEYKTRRQADVRESDIIQLSLQAWSLRRNGLPTADYGFVVFETGKARTRISRRVRLRGDYDCQAWVERYIRLITTNAIAKRARDGRCRSCAHARSCASSLI